MSVTLPPVPGQGNPRQLNAPGKLRQRIFLETRLQVANEAAPRSIEIIYEVQPIHAARGFRVTQGGRRTAQLGNGSHDLEHWIVLDGPNGQLTVVELRAIARAGNESRRGFSVRITT